MGREILTYDDLLQIVELMKSAEAFSEFHLKIGDIELDLRKSGGGASVPSSAPAVTGHPPTPEAPAASAKPTPTPPALFAAAPAIDIPAGSIVIKSPMVGTFYRSPEPGAKPFVEVGQKVDPETTVCIIEVMKLMNSISAGTKGAVTHIMANDAQPVEMGQVLIVIDPKG